TRMHLLDRANELVPLAELRQPHKIGDEQVPGESRPVFPNASAAPRDALLPLEMALLTNFLAAIRCQTPGIDNGVIRLACNRKAGLALGLVQFAGAVAALAADGLALKNRLAVAVHRVGHVVGLIAMAKQTVRCDRPAEMRIATLVAGREIPAFLGGIPGERGSEEIAFAVDQIRSTALPGADRELDLSHGIRDPLALSVPKRFPMPHALVLAFDLVAEVAKFQGVVSSPVVALQRRGIGNG